MEGLQDGALTAIDTKFSTQAGVNIASTVILLRSVKCANVSAWFERG